MSKKIEKKNNTKERRFVKEQIGKMKISSLEQDLLKSKWGQEIFKSEKEICRILNRKELL